MKTEEWRQSGSYFRYRDQFKIFYKEEGSGDYLLLLHGFPTASWDWHKIWPALSQQFRLLAPDFIGFGFSDKPRRYDYSIMDQADLVEALFQEKGIKNLHILAHDYGDTVAQELVARFLERENTAFTIHSIVYLNGGLFPKQHQPRRVQKLLISPIGKLLTYFLGRNKLRKTFREIFGPDTPPTEEEIDEFYRLIEYNRGKGLFHKLIRYMSERKQHESRWVQATRQQRFPQRLIDGAMDPVSGRHLADHYQQNVPRADVIILDSIGHYPQTEAPDVVLQHFREFHSKL